MHTAYNDVNFPCNKISRIHYKINEFLDLGQNVGRNIRTIVSNSAGSSPEIVKRNILMHLISELLLLVYPSSSLG